MAIRRILTILAPGIATGVSAIAAILPDTVWMDQKREVTQSYRRGFPIPVSTNVHNLLLEVKSDLIDSPQLESYRINTEQLNSVKPYTVFGFDMYSIGWIKSLVGGRLGVPEYFNHCDGYLETYGIHVNNAPVEWSKPAGQQLKKSLVISDEAKKFAIAKEFLHLFQNQPESAALINFINVALPLLLVRGLSIRFQLWTHPRPVRYVVYGMGAVIGATCWLTMKDACSVKFARDVDASLSALDVSYLRGGAEFYSSLVERNIALRSLLGADGPSVYTELGNDKELLRTKSLPVVERAEYFKHALRLRQETVPDEPTNIKDKDA